MAFQNKSLQRRIYIVSSIEVAAFNNESVWAVLFIDWYEQLEDVKKLQVKGHAEQCHWFWNQGYPKSKKKLRCQIVVLLFVCFFCCCCSYPMRHSSPHPTCRNHQNEDNVFEQKNIAHQTDAPKIPSRWVAVNIPQSRIWTWGLWPTLIHVMAMRRIWAKGHEIPNLLLQTRFSKVLICDDSDMFGKY